MPRGTYGPGPLNSWEDFSLYERCITRGIAGSILRVIYGNGNRIVQAPGVVAFSTEMLPDTRMFYTDGRKHIGSSIPRVPRRLARRTGRARNSSSRRPTSPTRRRLASTATACVTANRW
jgi:hypothetical protein